MTIERATMAEQYPYTPDKSTGVQRLQRRQWQALGTLYRTRANLYTVLELTVYMHERVILDQAARLIDEMITRNLAAQRSLSSIKNKKLAEKVKAEKS